jgi:hypothetical protein
MRKEIVIVMVLTLLMVACGPTDKDPPLTDKDFKKGTDGLKFEFLKSAPPDKVFEKENFEVASDIWNKGTYPVTEGYVTLTLENSYMCIPTGNQCPQTTGIGSDSLTQQLAQKQKALADLQKLIDAPQPEAEQQLQQEIETLQAQIAQSNLQAAQNSDIRQDLVNNVLPNGALNGKGIASPGGMSKLVKYTARSQQLDPLSVQHTSSVLLTACYGYSTELTADLCIDPDTSGTRLVSKVCEVKDQTFTDQGAPVAITKIETKILPENDYAMPQFVIYVKNLGKGKVVNRAKLKEACSAAPLGYDDWNMVTLSEFRLGSEKYSYSFATRDQPSTTFECKPNPLRLREEDNIIRCSMTGNAEKIKRTDPATITQAYIKLDYGYSQSAAKQVVIEKIEK